MFGIVTVLEKTFDLRTDPPYSATLCSSYGLVYAVLNIPVSFRDALSDLALHFLNKMKIMVIKDIEREEIEFICKV